MDRASDRHRTHWRRVNRNSHSRVTKLICRWIGHRFEPHVALDALTTERHQRSVRWGSIYGLIRYTACWLCGQTTAGFALKGWLEPTYDVEIEDESRIAEGLVPRSMAVSGDTQTEVPGNLLKGKVVHFLFAADDQNSELVIKYAGQVEVAELRRLLRKLAREASAPTSARLGSDGEYLEVLFRRRIHMQALFASLAERSLIAPSGLVEGHS